MAAPINSTATAPVNAATLRLRRAQRASPFVLMWLFNLVLYALYRVLTSTRIKGTRHLALRGAHALVVAYCVAVPAVCMGVALGLDAVPTDLAGGTLQLMRSSALCFVRLSKPAEFVLVYQPLILTGTGVVALSALAVRVLRGVQADVAGLRAASGTQERREIGRLPSRSGLERQWDIKKSLSVNV